MAVAHRVRMQGLYVRSGAQGAYHAGHAGRGAQNRASGVLMHADMSAQQVARKKKVAKSYPLAEWCRMVRFAEDKGICESLKLRSCGATWSILQPAGEAGECLQ